MTPSQRHKSDPRAHDIAVYPLFCEGLICSFRAGEGLDRGEISEQVAAFLIGLPPHIGRGPGARLSAKIGAFEDRRRLGEAGHRQGIVGNQLEILLRRNIDSP